MTKSITTELILEAAHARNWTTRQISRNPDIYAINTGSGAPYYIKNVTNYIGSGINGAIAKQKEILYTIVRDNGLATLPESLLYEGDGSAALAMLARHTMLVVKPTDQSHGDGVTVGIKTESDLRAAIEYAQTFSKNVIIQQHVSGRDYRVLCIDGVFAAATNREPASVVGDGHHTITELIAAENKLDTRGAGYERQLSYIDLEAAQRFLGDGINDVPQTDQQVQVVGTANIGAGGRAIDATDDMPQVVIDEAEALLNHLRLEFAGVDYIIDDGIAYLIEVNTAPSFGLHAYPSVGQPRDVANTYLDWLTKDQR